MSQSDKSHDYAHTLALPKLKMPMKVDQSELERALLQRWKAMNLYGELRKDSKGRQKFIVHDGPPYANGNIHVGHALNKVLKDAMVRSFQMRGYDAPLVPGWDCHGLPIEWKVEEKYRNAGLAKDEISTNEFRSECRQFAQHWVSEQAKEFERLGVVANFDDPYLTMDFKAEAAIARELMALATSGQVYRGSKPVMWSVVERTALAEAEVEHHEFESDTVWVKFPVVEGADDLKGVSVVVWTTTPWTLPANKALAFSSRVSYGLFEVVSVQRDYGPKVGERYLLAEVLAPGLSERAQLELRLVRLVESSEVADLVCSHPLEAMGYCGRVPMLDGDHVTATVGTGFVHTAPGHGMEDFDIWMRSASTLKEKGFDTRVPFIVDDAGYLTDEAHGFGPAAVNGAARVFDDLGKKGDANARLIEALIQADALVARSRLKHSYPHSWRSGKPVFYRNTPQWFVSMDKALEGGGTLRTKAQSAVEETCFHPESGRNRLSAMLEHRPDWVLSRQRRWGVPITLFHDDLGNVLDDPYANEKVLEAFAEGGSDAWFEEGAKKRFIGHRDDMERWHMVQDILDVWFDSGCTHVFACEDRPDLGVRADVYLEGSDQHRGWFQSSLLESCATRGVAPFKAVVTHGFVLGEDGLKMAKSKNNGLSPQKVVEKFGADVLRLWALSSDYQADVRVGISTLQSTQDAFRKLRNSFKWMTGMLAYDHMEDLEIRSLPELERLMLHRLVEMAAAVEFAYDGYDYKKVVRLLTDFMNGELSAFYFDVRKDALYCDAPSTDRRRASLFVLRHTFSCLTAWMAPLLPFLAEEAWLACYPEETSVHLRQFPTLNATWRDEALAEKWEAVKEARDAVNLCLEEARKLRLIGKALEAAPEVQVFTRALYDALSMVPLAEVFGTSGASLVLVEDRKQTLDEGEVRKPLAIVFKKASGAKCARSWLISDDVGSVPGFPDVSPRDAYALKEIGAVQ